MAAKRIVWGKFGPCAGQVCVGIDYILTEKKYLPKLVRKHVFIVILPFSGIVLRIGLMFLGGIVEKIYKAMLWR